MRNPKPRGFNEAGGYIILFLASVLVVYSIITKVGFWGHILLVIKTGFLGVYYTIVRIRTPPPPQKKKIVLLAIQARISNLEASISGVKAGGVQGLRLRVPGFRV